MPLPAQRTVTGLYTHPITGLPQTGSVIFAPVPAFWTDDLGNQIMAGELEITLVNGAFSQAVVPTDTPGVLPAAGKLYRFTEKITGESVRTTFFEIPTGGSSVDISDLIPMDPTPPPFLPAGTAGGDLVGSYPSPQLRNWQTGRDHLGLGDSATRNVGVDFGEVADGQAAALGTGIISGGGLSLNANPQAITVEALVGYVADYYTSPLSPVISRIGTATQTVPLVGASLSRSLTWWLMDATGAVIQQPDAPTNVQRRTHLVLGFSVYDTVGGSVFLTKAIPVPLPQIANQFTDLADAIGVFNVSGNVISPNGANLSINNSGGSVFARGFNYTAVPRNPHIRNTAAQAPAQFRIALRNTVNFAAPVTVIDPANYDNNGVLTAVGGGTNRATVQRVFLFAQDNAQDQLVVQYGQQVYASLSDAVAGINAQTFVVNPAFVAVLIGFIAVTRTATNLSDPAQAQFIPAAKFGSGAGASVSVASTAEAWRRRELPEYSAAEALYTGTAPVISTAQTTTPTAGFIKYAPAGVALAGSDVTGLFTYAGAGNFQIGTVSPDTSYVLPLSKYPNTYASGQSVWSVEFGCDAQNIQVRFKHISAATMFRLTIDGQKVTDLMQSAGGITPGSGHLMSINFGSAVPRRIRFDFSTFPFGGVYIPPTATLWGLQLKGGRFMTLTDSLGDGSAQNTGAGCGTWVDHVGRLMGVTDVWRQGRGGTGYITAGSYATFGVRAPGDVVAWSPTRLVIWGGFNDSGGNQTDILNAASSLYAAIKAGVPQCEVYVLGCWSPTGTPGASLTNTDNTLRTAAAQANYSFISPITGSVYNSSGTLVTTYGPWITTANSSVYIGGDATHPNDAGHAYLSRRISQAISALLPS